MVRKQFAEGTVYTILGQSGTAQIVKVGSGRVMGKQIELFRWESGEQGRFREGVMYRIGRAGTAGTRKMVKVGVVYMEDEKIELFGKSPKAWI